MCSSETETSGEVHELTPNRTRTVHSSMFMTSKSDPSECFADSEGLPNVMHGAVVPSSRSPDREMPIQETRNNSSEIRFLKTKHVVVELLLRLDSSRLAYRSPIRGVWSN
jgi:hypothetical protein